MRRNPTPVRKPTRGAGGYDMADVMLSLSHNSESAVNLRTLLDSNPRARDLLNPGPVVDFQPSVVNADPDPRDVPDQDREAGS